MYNCVIREIIILLLIYNVFLHGTIINVHNDRSGVLNVNY